MHAPIRCYIFLMSSLGTDFISSIIMSNLIGKHPSLDGPAGSGLGMNTASSAWSSGRSTSILGPMMDFGEHWIPYDLVFLHIDVPHIDTSATCREGSLDHHSWRQRWHDKELNSKHFQKACCQMAWQIRQNEACPKAVASCSKWLFLCISIAMLEHTFLSNCSQPSKLPRVGTS